ncbi:MAG: hypothetical protein ABGZ35_08010, partial [Planctomycetaceae bacterium]
MALQRSVVFRSWQLMGWGLMWALSAAIPTEACAGAWRVSTFQVDISPPIGQPVGLGFIRQFQTLEHPLLAKGVVIYGQQG